MHSLRLVFSLIRVPRLFATLFLFPIFVSLFVVYIQLIFSGAVITTTTPTTKEINSAIEGKRENNELRRYLLGIDDKLTDIKVCHWDLEDTETGLPKPFEDGCIIERFDVTIQTNDIRSFNVEPYVKIFKGNFKKIHICHKDRCFSDILLDKTGNTEISKTYSLWGLLLLNLIHFSNENKTIRVKEKELVEQNDKLIGDKYLQVRGFKDPTKIDDLFYKLIIICNIAALIIVALWLSIKAHRKVLDYFSVNGALLPMVGAIGKGSFYSAIWMLTGVRVFFFLLAAVPASYFSLNNFAKSKNLKYDNITDLFFGGNISMFSLWIIALISSFCLSTIIASIADLKHRYALLSLIYKYIPLFICLFGGILWGVTFLIDNVVSEQIRYLITALPLLGMPAILLAPIFAPPVGVMVAHTLMTCALLFLTLSANVRWFAAHLEEL